MPKLFLIKVGYSDEVVSTNPSYFLTVGEGEEEVRKLHDGWVNHSILNGAIIESIKEISEAIDPKGDIYGISLVPTKKNPYKQMGIVDRMRISTREEEE